MCDRAAKCSTVKEYGGVKITNMLDFNFPISSRAFAYSCIQHTLRCTYRTSWSSGGGSLDMAARYCTPNAVSGPKINSISHFHLSSLKGISQVFTTPHTNQSFSHRLRSLSLGSFNRELSLINPFAHTMLQYLSSPLCAMPSQTHRSV